MPDLIYLDNAATSWPKPPAVLEAMTGFARGMGVNPGRSGFDLALQAGAAIDRVRRELARFFALPGDDPDRLVFASNATDALNTALQGVCLPGDHVVSTVLEHNSVLRPLEMLARAGVITYDLAPCDGDGYVDPDEIARLIRPGTRLVAATHGSNVLGTIQPIAEIGAVCRERGVLLAVDAAQTAGQTDIDMGAMGIDLLAFTGHKSLLGPTGTGGLGVGPEVPIRSTRWGGTGVRSAERGHPEQFPYRLEAGTLNGAGIAGLGAGLGTIAERGGPAAIRDAEMLLARRLREGLEAIEGIETIGKWRRGACLPVFCCTVQGLDPADVGTLLDVDHGIGVRTGLHCAPLAHAALGAAPRGGIRFSVGAGNVEADIDAALAAMEEIATLGRRRGRS